MFAAIPPRQQQGCEAFAYWENFLTAEDISQLLSLPQWQQTQQGLIGVNSAAMNVPDIRLSQTAWFVPCEKTKHIWEKITCAIADANRTFFHYDLTGCYEPAQLSLYLGSEQGHYNWHIDMSEKTNSVPRKLSMSILLSDPADFQGGELQVKPSNDEPINVEQAKGRAWFFPSYMLHRVAPVTKGVRQSLVLWVGGPPFR
jgi:PKHD-type hydroxylase